MIRVIQFKGEEGRFDVPSFVLSENQNLILDIRPPLSFRGKYYFLISHGGQKKRVVLTKDCKVELTAEWLNAGGVEPIICQLEARDVSGIVLYKTYNVEPLNVSVSEVGIEYLGAVQAVEKENAELRKELGELKKVFADLKGIVVTIPAEIQKAKKEAVIEAAGGDPMGA